MLATLALLAATAPLDPRIELVELQLSGRPEDALRQVEERAAADPDHARRLGLPFLRGHLLDSLSRPDEAHRAFADVLGSLPELADYALYRLAVNQSRQGHPEVAAGLLAKLLAGRPPAELVASASDLLVRALDDGGDCRLLTNLQNWPVPRTEHRRLELARADCALRAGDRDRAARDLIALLRSETRDETARGAAERLHTRFPDLAARPEVALSVGQTFHRHRQFDLSTRYLAEALGARATTSAPTASPGEAEALYDLARGHFWLGDYLLAASRFGQLAARLPTAGQRARPLFQQGRCYELAGNWDLAANSFRLAYTTDPNGEWAGASLLAAMRLEWRMGGEETALELYELLASRRDWLGHFYRAALFLASSDVVRGRGDRAEGWLDDAARWSQAAVSEIAYWRGRRAELVGDADAAVGHYLAAWTEDPLDPIARAAATRLAAPALAPRAVARARRLADSRGVASLITAWLVLGDDHPDGRRARLALEQRLLADARARPFLQAAPLPPDRWPLWQTALRQPEELLLALGVWDQTVGAMLRHFPASDVSLGLTASALLARAGEHRRSLYIAEILGQRIPPEVPDRLLPDALRRLIYPLPYRRAIEGEAARRGIDPYLLAGIIREESRFDPRALSAASARGLTQFVLPTARRLGGRIGLERLTAADLHEPSVSIALGAAYLAELSEGFAGETHAAVAAYNAGEDQAQLWRSYCYSRELDEYLAKVGFAETRRYLGKVLRSRNQYAAIYGE